MRFFHDHLMNEAMCRCARQGSPDFACGDVHMAPTDASGGAECRTSAVPLRCRHTGGARSDETTHSKAPHGGGSWRSRAVRSVVITRPLAQLAQDADHFAHRRFKTLDAFEQLPLALG